MMEKPKFDPTAINVSGFWPGSGSDSDISISLTYGPEPVPISEQIVSTIRAASATESGMDIDKASTRSIVDHVQAWWDSLDEEEKIRIDEEMNPKDPD